MEHGPARGGLLNVHTEYLVVTYPSLPTESKRFNEDDDMIHQKLPSSLWCSLEIIAMYATKQTDQAMRPFISSVNLLIWGHSKEHEADL